MFSGAESAPFQKELRCNFPIFLKKIPILNFFFFFLKIGISIQSTHTHKLHGEILLHFNGNSIFWVFSAPLPMDLGAFFSNFEKNPNLPKKKKKKKNFFFLGGGGGGGGEDWDFHSDSQHTHKLHGDTLL